MRAALLLLLANHAKPRSGAVKMARLPGPCRCCCGGCSCCCSATLPASLLSFAADSAVGGAVAGVGACCGASAFVCAVASGSDEVLVLGACDTPLPAASADFIMDDAAACCCLTFSASLCDVRGERRAAPSAERLMDRLRSSVLGDEREAAGVDDVGLVMLGADEVVVLEGTAAVVAVVFALLVLLLVLLLFCLLRLAVARARGCEVGEGGRRAHCLRNAGTKRSRCK